MNPQKREESEVQGVKKEQQEEEDSTKNRVWDAMLADPDAEGGGHLTIFYNGSICVCDDMTPAKAQAIMLIAAASSAAASWTESADNKCAAINTTAAAAAAAANAAALMRSLSRQSSSVPAAAAQVPSGPGANSFCKLQAELPHARRHSLQQFMEKRRSRLVSKAPYASAKKSDEGLEAGLEGKPQLT